MKFSELENGQWFQFVDDVGTDWVFCKCGGGRDKTILNSVECMSAPKAAQKHVGRFWESKDIEHKLVILAECQGGG